MPKNSLLVLGLMSGTSADGIEVALVRISGTPPKLNSKLLGHHSLPIPKPIRAAILRIAEGLDHSHRQRVQDLRASFQRGAVTIQLRVRGDAAEDIRDAERSSALFEREFHTHLYLRPSNFSRH